MCQQSLAFEQVHGNTFYLGLYYDNDSETAFDFFIHLSLDAEITCHFARLR
jgi:hypothetical protein